MLIETDLSHDAGGNTKNLTLHSFIQNLKLYFQSGLF